MSNLNQRRFAVASALAASAVTPLVMARGHRVQNVPEIPLVITNELESTIKTQKAIETLKAVGAYDDVRRVKSSRGLRRGQGKSRNRRYVQRRGPLVIYNRDNGLVKAVRNIPGVDFCCVTRLNLLQLAPGGHLGRFCVWTQDAFEKLDSLYGTQSKLSQRKKGYHIPRVQMVQPDLQRLIKSDEVQSVLRAKTPSARVGRKKNALKNLGVMAKLNPYAIVLRRSKILGERKKRAKVAKDVQKRLHQQKVAFRKQFAE